MLMIGWCEHCSGKVSALEPDPLGLPPIPRCVGCGAPYLPGFNQESLCSDKSDVSMKNANMAAAV